ncbi:hypothetical protein LCGC14_0380370 [marine sediment metagenome]|uniref:Uncharacterized protein n=1 Tax=marine sediment metagenome TaxID=412755 RepID=A0A0F9VPN1_9ZZZZ
MECNLKKPIYLAATKFTFTETKDGFFLDGFLISDKINANGWMATANANKLDGQDFVGKPDIEFINPKGKRDHTTGDTVEKSLKAQEPFRKGTIKIVKGTDDGIRLTAVSQITDPLVIQKIKNKEIQWYSPAIFPRSLEDVEIIQTGPNTHIHIVHRYKALHRAMVDEPAYGGDAGIGLTCDGNSKDCLIKLQQVNAGIDTDNIDPLRTVPLIVSKCSKTGNLVIEMEASELTDEVARCLSKKLGPGEKATDEDTAICFSEARKNLNSKRSNNSLIAEKKKKNNKMPEEDEIKEKVDTAVKAKIAEIEKEVKEALKAKAETEEENKDAETEEEKKARLKARKAKEDEDDITEGKKGKKGKKGNEDITEEEKKALEEDEKKDAKIASLEGKFKTPLIKKYIAAKMNTPGFDEAQATALTKQLNAKTLDEVEEKWNEIAPFVAVNQINVEEDSSQESEIGYYPKDYTGSTSDLDDKTTDQLLEEAEAL